MMGRKEIARVKVEEKTLKELKRLSDEYKGIQGMFVQVASELATLMDRKDQLKTRMRQLNQEMSKRSEEMRNMLRVIAAGNGIDPDSLMELDVDKGELIIYENPMRQDLKPTEKPPKKEKG